MLSRVRALYFPLSSFRFTISPGCDLVFVLLLLFFFLVFITCTFLGFIFILRVNFFVTFFCPSFFPRATSLLASACSSAGLSLQPPSLLESVV